MEKCSIELLDMSVGFGISGSVTCLLVLALSEDLNAAHITCRHLR